MPSNPEGLRERTWIRVPAGDAAKAVLTTALERGFHTFVAAPEDADRLRGLGKFRLLTLNDEQLAEDDEPLGPRVPVTSTDEQQDALDLASHGGWVVVDTGDWRVIPLENLIAAYQGQTRLAALAKGPEDVKLLLTTLEVGVDAAIAQPRSADDVIDLAEALQEDRPREELVEGEIVSVKPVGVGDRVCVDTASLLRAGEGLLVGSSASGLFLVASETLESGYVASRPFRVNAGPVHAYALLPGGRTKYLSELRAGDEVLAVNARGETRPVTIGRVKIEVRPLLLLTAKAGDKTVSTLLQNAETIRLTAPDGDTKSVVDLQPGDPVLLRLEEGGRHFGTPVRETIQEI